MRDDLLYLHDIIDTAFSLNSIVQSTSEVEFLVDDIIQSAILYKLIIIGEACSRLSVDLKSKYSKFSWKAVTAFRNIVVHEYFGVTLSTVWNSAIYEFPQLVDYVNEILNNEFGIPTN